MDWDQLDKDYKYQPILTDRLDDYKGDFTQEVINEIVLWKVNRYAELDNALLAKINCIPHDEEYRMDDSELLILLEDMLKTRGVRLPMASSFLRFRNPHAYQIIDQRVYRFLYQKNMTANPKPNEYITYLHDLRAYCKKVGIPFYKADRLLYEADKENPEPLRY